MPILTAKGTFADLESTTWREVLAAAKKLTCEEFRDGFCRIAIDAQEAAAPSAAMAKMLACLTSLRLQPGNTKDPLHAYDGSFAVSSFGEHDVVFLAELEEQVEDSDFRARIQDVLYVNSRDAKAGIRAIESYVDAAQRLDFNENFDAINRFERAARLSLALNQKDKQELLRTILVSHISSAVSAPSFILSNLSSVLLALKCEKHVEMAEALILHAEVSAVAGNRIVQRRLLELAANWYRIAGKNDEYKAQLRRAAETFVEEADHLATVKNISFGQPAVLIEQAIEAFRQIGGEQERVEELLRVLDVYQQKFVPQMIPLSDKMNLDDLSDAARSQVNKPSLHEAVMAFVQLSSPSKKAELAAGVKSRGDKFIGHFLFANVMVTSTGKRVAAQAPLKETDDEESPAFLAEMFRTAVLHRQIRVLGLIEPARIEIAEKHYVRYEDIGDFVWHSAIVPPDRKPIVTEGLLAGFEGNYVVSTHLLVPQIEHIIRHLLAGRGVRTNSYDDDGIQDVHDLNTTLRNPVLAEILGEDLAFDLRGLLIERFGSNLRNEFAHGMRSYEDFRTVECAYCWWLVLRLVCITSAHPRSNKHSDESPPEDREKENDV